MLYIKETGFMEPGSILFAPSLQLYIHILEIPPETSFLWAKQSHLSQPFLIGEMLQSLIIFVALCWTLSSMPLSLL